jgi:hypothetical protein
MQSYEIEPSRAMPDAGVAAHTPRTTPPDPRLAAFADLVAAFDRRDWRAGQLATRRLRELGFSVCLVAARPARSGGR